MRISKSGKYNNEDKFITLNLPKINKSNTHYIILNNKDKIKFIKQIERMIRSSIEYKQYIHFLKTEMDMTSCTFFNKINNRNGEKISIEIHHEPFTLFDIVNIVVDKYLDNDKLELNPFIISEEVMEIHYKNKVGLIPLSITVHQLVHDGKLFIPLQYIYGKYSSFIKDYEKYISNDIKDMILVKYKMSRELEELDLSILEPKYVYIEVDGFKLPQLVA